MEETREKRSGCYGALGESKGDPFRNLWATVMKDALDMLNAGSEQGRWFFTSPYSNFKWICTVLELDFESVKKKVLDPNKLRNDFRWK